MEESVFRGYSFERMISAIGLWPAQILTALALRCVPRAARLELERGARGHDAGSILFGLVFVRWRSVPAALGVHAAGNWMRDLLLSDPATARTFVSPVSVRQWTPLEQFTARVVWNGFVVVACVAMAVIVYRHRARERAGAGAA